MDTINWQSIRVRGELHQPESISIYDLVHIQIKGYVSPAEIFHPDHIYRKASLHTPLDIPIEVLEDVIKVFEAIQYQEVSPPSFDMHPIIKQVGVDPYAGLEINPLSILPHSNSDLLLLYPDRYKVAGYESTLVKPGYGVIEVNALRQFIIQVREHQS